MFKNNDIMHDYEGLCTVLTSLGEVRLPKEKCHIFLSSGR